MPHDDPPTRASAVARWDEARARTAAHDGNVGAVITWIEPSRRDAEAADGRRRAGHPQGPLDGVLVGVKDNIDVAGVPATAGAAFLADHVATSGATVIRLLRDSGAVVTAKLNMAELAFGTTTENRTFGSCRNPWDLHRTAGGSSGGPGAALAAGFCDLALGTDTGGSVRIPAALNGVVGLRPSRGSISIAGVLPVAPSVDTVGPMARLAVDVARATEALSVADPADPWSVAGSGPPATSLMGSPIAGMRVGIARDHFYDELDDGVGAVIEDFLAWLVGQGAEATEVPDFGATEAAGHCVRIIRCEGAAFHQDRLDTSPEDFAPDVRAKLASGTHVPGTDLVRSLEYRQRYGRRLAAVFDDVDVVVTPTVTVETPIPEGQESFETTRALGRATLPWSLYDGPTLNVPVGFHPRSGTPVGVSITGRRFGEATLFQVAAAYQETTDWHTRRPPLVPA